MFALAALKAVAMAALAGLSGLAIAEGLQANRPLHDSTSLASITDTVSLKLSGGRHLTVARYEVSWQEWQRCHDAGACSYLPPRTAATRSKSFPVTGVSRFDVDEFIAWVNRGSSIAWRLPTAAEWAEFASELPRKDKKKLFTDPRLAWAADYGQMEKVPKRLKSQGSFGTFSNGVSDLAGNVWEWTSSCAGNAADDHCPALVVEGLHEAVLSVFVRDPATGGCAAGTPPANIGFRLVADL